MFINNLVNLRERCKFRSGVVKRLKNISATILIISAILLLFYLFCSLGEPTVTNDMKEFYGYGRYVSYNNYDIDDKEYRIISSVYDIGENSKIASVYYGYYAPNKKHKDLFDKQKNTVKNKYITNVTCDTHTKGTILIVDITLILVISSFVFFVISALISSVKSI